MDLSYMLSLAKSSWADNFELEEPKKMLAGETVLTQPFPKATDEAFKKCYVEVAADFNTSPLAPIRANYTTNPTTTNVNKAAATSTKNIPRSYADVVGPNRLNINLPAPRSECMSFAINRKAYEEYLKLCKFSLIGRVILTKGDHP